jgi:diadenosine tetraphosphate (Ap4A) HIT family hydrolase
MTTTLSEFSAKFQVEPLTILKLKYWTWSIRPVQCTLGASILSLNRFCTSFGDITEGESGELGAIAKLIERGLSAAFRPDKLNFIMLMMVDAHLHFHVIPRYAAARDLLSIRWVDNGWPSLPSLNDGSQYQGDPALTGIRDALIGANRASA